MRFLEGLGGFAHRWIQFERRHGHRDELGRLDLRGWAASSVKDRDDLGDHLEQFGWDRLVHLGLVIKGSGRGWVLDHENEILFGNPLVSFSPTDLCMY